MRNLLEFFIKYSYWFLFILLEVISFGLLFRFNSYQGSVYFTSANWLSGTVYEISNGVTSYFHLKSVNEELMERNIYLEQQVSALREEFIKATRDTAWVDSIQHSVLKDFIMLKAEVINNSINWADNYITLNKGEQDGVRSEMGVMDGNGVVGIVYLTASHYSIVIPVLNSKSSISCKIQNSDYFGYLKWDGADSRYAYLMDLPRHSVCEKGDTIVTSGFTSIFPSGIMVGTVDEIADSHDGLSYLLKVKLSTDFGKLKDVRVIARKDMAEQKELEQKIKK